MRILIIHNKYKQRGGEDIVFEEEQSLLKQNNIVDTLIFDNSTSNPIFNVINIFQSIYNVKSKNKLRQKIIQFSPDIIHVHNFFFIASPSIFVIAHKMGIPIILTLHNYRTICCNGLLLRNHKPCTLCVNKKFPLIGIKNKCYKSSVILSFFVTAIMSVHKLIGTWNNNISTYIVLTNFQKNIFIHSSLLSSNKNRFIVKTNSTEDFGPGNSIRKNYFLFVGRLSIEKGLSTLLSSMEYYQFNLYIIGEGPLEKSLIEKASNCENIAILGRRPASFIRQTMKNSKALIFPSLWYEGLPLTIIEAFSTSTPVICSNIGAAAEIVQNGINGLHFKTGDCQNLANTIKRFDLEYSSTTNMNIAARETFLERYTKEKNLASLMGIYQNLIK